MKRSFFLTVMTIVFALSLALLPMQDNGALAQSYDNEQQVDSLIEPDETYPSETPYDEEQEEDPVIEMEETYPSETLYEDEPQEDPLIESDETYPSEAPYDEEQEDDLVVEMEETNPSGVLGEEDSANELGNDSSDEGYPTDETIDAATAAGMAIQPVIPPKCQQAAGHALYILSNSGLGGISYLQPSARISFDNRSSSTYQIRVTPANIVTNHSFSLPAGNKITIFASSTSKFMSGSIVANAGSGDKVQDIVKCP